MIVGQRVCTASTGNNSVWGVTVKFRHCKHSPHHCRIHRGRHAEAAGAFRLHHHTGERETPRLQKALVLECLFLSQLQGLIKLFREATMRWWIYEWSRDVRAAVETVFANVRPSEQAAIRRVWSSSSTENQFWWQAWSVSMVTGKKKKQEGLTEWKRWRKRNLRWGWGCSSHRWKGRVQKGKGRVRSSNWVSSRTGVNLQSHSSQYKYWSLFWTRSFPHIYVHCKAQMQPFLVFLQPCRHILD